MLEKFKEHITQNLPFLRERKLLVAISGGIDSVVLTHLLHALHFDFALIHCNFKLRYDDSDMDEVFVQKIATEFHIPCYTKSFETKTFADEKGLSIQMAARELRYNWFNEILENEGYDYIVTAHQADDNLETVMINLIRGCSMDGLVGIPETNGKVIRPLLPFSRVEIQQYTIEKGIIWREDESNQSIKYLRNKIRHQVIPTLKDLNKNLLTVFNTNLNYLKDEKKVLENHISQVKNEVCVEAGKLLKLDIQKLKRQGNITVYLYHILKGYGFTEWRNVAELLDAQPGKFISSKTHRLIKDREFLILAENTIHLPDAVFEVDEKAMHIEYPLSLNFEQVQEGQFLSEEMICIDADKLIYPLRLRRKKEGDVFVPFGMKGSKKLSKFFKDEKLSLIEKENTWLLCNGDDEIIWVVGKRLDDRFKLSTVTNKILKITLNY